jgi:Ca2+-binding EF-hand superfamily protein
VLLSLTPLHLHSPLPTLAFLVVQVDLTVPEIATLKDHYACQDGKVDYRTFCDQIDRVFTEKNLERSPTKQPRKFSKELHPFGGTLKGDDNRRADNVMGKVRNWVYIRGVIPKTMMCDFDVSNNGYITESQFKRVLQMLNMTSLAMNEIDLICQKYKDANGDVNYRRFHEDASNPPASTLRGASSPSSSPSAATFSGHASSTSFNPPPSSSSSGVDGIMRRLVRAVSSQRMRIKDVFVDYDHRRTGRVTTSRFKRGLCTAFGNAFEEFELDLLAAQYKADSHRMGDGVEDDDVDYRSFVAEIDCAFTEPGLEKSPTKRIGQSRSAHVAKEARYAPNATTAEEARQLAGYMSDMRVKVQQRRIDMKDVFQDFDRNKRETVTMTQFERVLKSRELLEEGGFGKLDLLMKKYSFLSSAHGVRLVHYNAFLNDLVDNKNAFVWSDGAGAFGVNTKFLVEADSRPFDPTASGSGGGGEHKHHDHDHRDHLPGILHSVRQHVSGKRIRIHEFFSDYDPLRRGRITFSQFTSGLARMMPTLPPAHLSVVVQEFVAHDSPSGYREDQNYVGGQPLIDWRRFCGDVNEVFTLPGLEMQPTCDVLAATSSALAMGSPTRRLSGNTTSLATATLNELMLHVVTRNKLVPPDFQAYDHANRGTLPNTQFLRALNSAFYDFITPSKDMKFEAIAQMYRVYDINRETASSRYDVDYRTFCRDIEEKKALVSMDASNEAGGAAAASSMLRFDSEAKGGDVNVGGVMARLQKIVKTRGINIKALMQIHDQLRTGKVTRAKFTASLDMALGTQAGSIKAADVRAVADRYISMEDTHASYENPDVNYAKFVFDLTSEGAEELERFPTKELSPLKFSRFSEQGFQGDNGLLNSVLNEIRRKIQIERADLKPYFQDYDKLRTGKVPKTKFQAVLGNLNLKPGSGRPGMQVLLDAFEEDPDKCNYVRFCERVEWDMHAANGVRK